MAMKKHLLCFVAVLAAGLSCSLLAATTYYADNVNGSESYDGLAAAYDGAHGPKAKIQSAVALCAAAALAEPPSPESFWRVSQDSNGVWWAISPVSRAADSSGAEEGGKATFLRGIDHPDL